MLVTLDDVSSANIIVSPDLKSASFNLCLVIPRSFFYAIMQKMLKAASNYSNQV